MRNLTLAYTLAGVDCIDVAADQAVIAAARDGMQAACRLTSKASGLPVSSDLLPWLMVSLNDAEDPHFRKAEFDPTSCPPDCPRPCEKICPAEAIVFDASSFSGVIDQRCYGCGRCVPICPLDRITTRSYVTTPTTLAPLVLEAGVDAIEIHTQVGHLQDFERLWQAIEPWLNGLKLVAISCPDGPDLINYLRALHHRLAPLPCPLIWQTDGRPMSGDIGAGTTIAAVKLAQKVLAAGLPGYVQLAGGTNHHTVNKLKATGLLKSTAKTHPSGISSDSSPHVAGVAYGSYARKLLSPVLEALEQVPMNLAQPVSQAQEPLTAATDLHLENHPDRLSSAIHLAKSLVGQLKADE